MVSIIKSKMKLIRMQKGDLMQEEKQYLRTHRSALITVNKDENMFKVEFSPGTAYCSVSKYFAADFPFVSWRQEVGELSRSKKHIFYVNLAGDNGLDPVRLKLLADHFEGEHVEIRYRYGEEGELRSDWPEYVYSVCHDMPTPKDLGYKLFVNKYGNVSALHGLPDGWHETELTVTQLKKIGIPNFKACTGFAGTCSRFSKPIVVNIIPDDFSGQEEEYLDQLLEKKNREKEKQKNKEKEKVDSIPIAPELIGECLYSINKEAKIYRDAQEECWHRAYDFLGDMDSGVYYQLHYYKDCKNKLYNLKDEALRKAIKVWNLKPEGYHVFPDINRDMYEFGGYTFHVNEQTSDKCLGEINEKITAERKKVFLQRRRNRF